MIPEVLLYSKDENEIEKFLNTYYGNDVILNNKLEWKKDFENPIEIVTIMGVFVDNKDKYNINMWLKLDPEISINITENNVEKIIRYLYERYPN